MLLFKTSILKRLYTISLLLLLFGWGTNTVQAQQCTRAVSNTQHCGGQPSYVFWTTNGRFLENGTNGLTWIECGNTAYFQGTMNYIPGTNDAGAPALQSGTWTITATFTGKTNFGSPYAHAGL